MKAREIRQKFFTYFESKDHKIVPSAPIVNKNDPTLMFTNAGMNQFKDYFLGNKKTENSRIADTQKCLRVSGKHNDLEEVGIDSYHHTMFEMLGNWSFGDYFKKEAISWAWDLLTEQYGLESDRLYATVFGGDDNEKLGPDNEAADFWKDIIPADRVLYFDKKDNFWEMGDTGPCGPCSEIHIDLRSEEERQQMPGRDLVNRDHPLVVEIWNLVFIQYNRKSDGQLEELPAKHVDTGMGFERLCMAVQGKTSNYDTDLFAPYFSWLENKTGKKYTGKYDSKAKKDIAFRVVVDHARAVGFTIADGQLPGNTGAGYVIRRILRRAVRYYYSFLDYKEPLIHELVSVLATSFSDVFPELQAQAGFVAKIIHEEERSFLRTLDSGLKRIGQVEVENNLLDGKVAFELYDTYGFPIDLTRLIGQDEGWQVDEAAFEAALQEQKERSRADAKREAGDWIAVNEQDQVQFVGYDHLSASGVHITMYRTVLQKKKKVFQLVLDKTPFYAESGGQVGDTGSILFGDQQVKVLDTQRENDLIVHIVDQIPADPALPGRASVNVQRRKLITNNHTATHLMHAALRQVLGPHVEQRGSLVNDRYLRFDFSHFEKMSEQQIRQVENMVNTKIRENIRRGEQRNVPIEEAKKAGAMMLFGEKYGDFVRMITFDPGYSVELCGGCHVGSTGEIGLFKIKSESAIAAGIRRIEAVTAGDAIRYMEDLIGQLRAIQSLFKSPDNTIKHVERLIEENKQLGTAISKYKAEKNAGLKATLANQFEPIGHLHFLMARTEDLDMDAAKALAHDLVNSQNNGVVLLAIEQSEKVNLILAIDRELAGDKLHAGNLIRSLSRHISGGGGGQPFFATSGGKDATGIDRAADELRNFLISFSAN